MLLLAGCGVALAGEAELKRIQELEERVRKLEQLVLQLAEARTDSRMEALLAEARSPQTIAEAPAKAAPEKRPAFTPPQELLPNLGKIGAAASFFAGGQTGVYGLGGGRFFGGAVELPLTNVPGGRLLYEFSAGLMSGSGRGLVTSNVAQVANLATLSALGPNPNLLTDALNGQGRAPFPVTFEAENRIRLLQVVPFGLKYTVTSLDRWRIRPYGVAGLGTYVTISNQKAATGVRTDADLPADLKQTLQDLFQNQAPFGGSLIGGQIAVSNQLSRAGIPSGQGNLDFGFQGGGGVELRMNRNFSFGLELRRSWLGGGVGYSVVTTRGGFHF